MLRFLGLLAQLGVVFFMFPVGRELPFPLLRGSGGRALVTGQSAIAVPFLAGAALAVTLLAGYRPTTVSPVAFVLFLRTMGLTIAFCALMGGHRRAGHLRRVHGRTGRAPIPCGDRLRLPHRRAHELVPAADVLRRHRHPGQGSRWGGARTGWSSSWSPWWRWPRKCSVPQCPAGWAGWTPGRRRDWA
jgi:hypothetical protein